VLADAIVEVTETGSSLRANGCASSNGAGINTKFIVNPAPGRSVERQKIETSSCSCKAPSRRGKVGLMLNVLRSDLEKVLAVLPALKRPTISALSDSDWVAVNTVIEEKTVREIIPRLKARTRKALWNIR